MVPEIVQQVLEVPAAFFPVAPEASSFLELDAYVSREPEPGFLESMEMNNKDKFCLWANYTFFFTSYFKRYRFY